MSSDCFGSPESRLDDGVIYIDLALDVSCAPCTMLCWLLKMEDGNHKDMSICETLAVRAFRLEVPSPSPSTVFHPYFISTRNPINEHGKSIASLYHASPRLIRDLLLSTGRGSRQSRCRCVSPCARGICSLVNHRGGAYDSVESFPGPGPPRASARFRVTLPATTSPYPALLTPDLESPRLRLPGYMYIYLYIKLLN